MVCGWVPEFRAYACEGGTHDVPRRRRKYPDECMHCEKLAVWHEAHPPQGEEKSVKSGGGLKPCTLGGCSAACAPLIRKRRALRKEAHRYALGVLAVGKGELLSRLPSELRRHVAHFL